MTSAVYGTVWWHMRHSTTLLTSATLMCTATSNKSRRRRGGGFSGWPRTVSARSVVVSVAVGVTSAGCRATDVGLAGVGVGVSGMITKLSPEVEERGDWANVAGSRSTSVALGSTNPDGIHVIVVVTGIVMDGQCLNVQLTGHRIDGRFERLDYRACRRC